MKKLLLITFVISLTASIQAIESQYHITPESIMKHIEVLAHDSLEGRQIGEPGELKAAEYIRAQFKAAGLSAIGTDNYFQYYDFLKEIKITPENNSFNINGTSLVLHEDYIPLKVSFNNLQYMPTAYDDLGTQIQRTSLNIIDVNFGIKISDDSGVYNDYANKDVKGKIVSIKRFAPDKKDYPHVDFSKHELLIDKINTAIAHKVSSIIFYTPEGHDDTLVDQRVIKILSKEIPIFFFKKSGMEKINQVSDTYDMTFYIELDYVRDTSQNVIGIVEGETDTTVIIGAHYDHLGWGDTYASSYKGEPAIHNGADDNASGVAALIELAHYYAQAKEKPHYSMLFIAFSGEEAGLLGASNFAKNMTIDSSKVRMMLNMDMIGRLKEQDKGLAIMGVGTTNEFTNFFDSLNYQDVKLTLSNAGYAASDHTAFTTEEIPALHIFTGAHKDYHKPSDDIEMIDADGIVKVTRFMNTLISYFDTLEKPLTFTKPKSSHDGKRRKKYSVTLGVIPDHVTEVQGFRIDGVMADKPAEKAGMLKGDIIKKLGEVVINDIYDYMNALSKFKKGDTVTAIVKRGDKEIELSVTF